MKKVLALIISAVIIISVSLPAAAKDSEYDFIIEKSKDLQGTELNVYNWGEYISDGLDDSLDVNKYFEELTGIKVNYTNYDTNEDMYTKLKSGGTSYDIIIPSDYMIARLIDEDMLLPLDFSNIPHYSNIYDEYKNLYFDPENKYSVPYNVGMVGVIYDKTVVDEKDIGSWELLFNSKYKDKILQFNNPRDAFATAQFYLGLDINSNDKSEWLEAYNKLVEQKPLLQSYVADEVFSKMEGGEAAVATYYAGDYLIMADVNENLDFYYPREGTNIFVDSVCIPKSAKNKLAAELYIDFLLCEEVALANAEYICYASPNRKVVESDEYSLKGNEYLYPDKASKPKCEYYYNLNRDMLNYESELWNNLKLEGSSNATMYVGLSAVIVLSIAAALGIKIKKKKRSRLYDV